MVGYEMTNTHTKLLTFWQRAADELGFELDVPFILTLPSGHELEALMLIRRFGGTNGMLIFGEFKEIQPYADDVVAAGYGVSVLSEPLGNEKYDRERYVEMLKDWGWGGDVEAQPDWL